MSGFKLQRESPGTNTTNGNGWGHLYPIQQLQTPDSRAYGIILWEAIDTLKDDRQFMFPVIIWRGRIVALFLLTQDLIDIVINYLHLENKLWCDFPHFKHYKFIH